jgi:hypothetical protein
MATSLAELHELEAQIDAEISAIGLDVVDRVLSLISAQRMVAYAIEMERCRVAAARRTGPAAPSAHTRRDRQSTRGPLTPLLARAH